jgi:hypothetical protein
MVFIYPTNLRILKKEMYELCHFLMLWIKKLQQVPSHFNTSFKTIGSRHLIWKGKEYKKSLAE